jgi:hypothetical protein
MSRPIQASAPRPEMVNAIAEMLRNLEQICPDPSIVGRCPELPGIVLDKVWATCLDREGTEYAKVNRDFDAMRAEYFKALVAHPVGRSLALLAVGGDGVEMLELGRPPAFVTETRSAPGTPTRARRDSYNCHHIVPKSVRPQSNSTLVNRPTNFVVAKTTRRGRDQSENPHHFWHSLLLHPQTHNAPAEPIPLSMSSARYFPSIRRSPRASARPKNSVKNWLPSEHPLSPRFGNSGFWNFQRRQSTGPTLFQKNSMKSPKCLGTCLKPRTKTPP